jgi:hypothetical protein
MLCWWTDWIELEVGLVVDMLGVVSGNMYMMHY